MDSLEQQEVAVCQVTWEILEPQVYKVCRDHQEALVTLVLWEPLVKWDLLEELELMVSLEQQD